MGWGDTNINHAILESSDVLMNVELSVNSREEFKESKFVNGSITNNMLCTRVADGKSDCYGDSGEPLVIKGDSGGSDLQVGTVLWVIVYGLDLFPSVFSCISQAYD
jgi:hypothetical protein